MRTQIKVFNFLFFRLQVVLLVLLSFATQTYGQKNKPSFSDSSFENEWWFPLIKKHNIDQKQFPAWHTFKPSPNDMNSFSILEIAKSSIIQDTMIIYTDPIIFIKENEENYNIASAKSSNQRLRTTQIRLKDGTMESFKFKANDTISDKRIAFKELILDIRRKGVTVIGAKGVLKLQYSY
jgi:hypothetical protein